MVDADQHDPGAAGGASDFADADAAAAAPALLLDTLPRTVLSSVLERVIAGSNPASVVALALTCRAMYTAIASADGLWQRQAALLGWTDRWEASARSGGGSNGERPFALYSARMNARRRIRRLVAAVTTYLDRRAAVAFARGAGPAQLAAAEARLGVALPWELWELLRHRDGQAPGPGVALADDARLLGAGELFLERRELPPITLAPERMPAAKPGGGAGGPAAAAAALLPAADGPRGWEGPGCFGGGGVADSATQPSSSGSEAAAQQSPSESAPLVRPRQATLVVFASNPGGSRMFGVDAGTGEVHVLRGLITTRRMAAGVGAFLERLLA